MRDAAPPTTSPLWRGLETTPQRESETVFLLLFLLLLILFLILIFILILLVVG
jgi:hypothetical protein